MKIEVGHVRVLMHPVNKDDIEVRASTRPFKDTNFFKNSNINARPE